MALVACRACEHQVDTSALACPKCGATRPGHWLSAQWFHLIMLIIELAVGFGVLYAVGTKVWQEVGPIIKTQMEKLEHTPTPSP